MLPLILASVVNAVLNNEIALTVVASIVVLVVFMLCNPYLINVCRTVVLR